MHCIAFVRCAGFVAFGLSIPLGSRAQAPAPSPPACGVSRMRSTRRCFAVPSSPRRPTRSAREAALLQAGARPNPTVSRELEDFAGSGEFRGLDSAQTKLLVGQSIELGGRRGAGKDVLRGRRVHRPRASAQGLIGLKP